MAGRSVEGIGVVVGVVVGRERRERPVVVVVVVVVVVAIREREGALTTQGLAGWGAALPSAGSGGAAASSAGVN